MHEALALGDGLLLVYEVFRQRSVRNELESVPYAGVGNY